jgi:hypothetical protein
LRELNVENIHRSITLINVLESAYGKEDADVQGTAGEDVLMVRRCSRLALQDGQKVEERAMERAKVKNLCADAGNLIPSYLDVEKPLDMFHLECGTG